MPAQAARDSHDASARVQARLLRGSGPQDLDLGFPGRVHVMSSSTGRLANARRPLLVTAPAAEIELGRHIVDWRTAQRVSQRPRHLYDELARIPVTAPHFFRKNATTGFSRPLE
jgi:hypothetical protein